MDKPKQERRNEARRRRRALKRARITFKGRWATIDLVLDNAPVRGCRVTWRKATQIGVEFA